MARMRTVTHGYRLATGWEKIDKRPLTLEVAEDLRARGYTMVVAKRGLFDAREISLNQLIPPR
ncbi:alternative tryptophan synthase beta-subunit [Microbacterium enclense]|uniref:alternative tryptophan synthase beta-subunit n=1 Tax=Microbacterium enclense TaxID=993073 RepID=UPI0021A92682|nr:alternative tryptophan synthase beta-subunit [Microbacterium enclense]MCT2085669.1 alternative tryptophan synthase beta-subunit [Microbacterium enclense]